MLKVSAILSAAFLLALAAYFFLSSGTTVNVHNLSDTKVHVTTKWKNNSLIVGEIFAGESTAFAVKDETSMLFEVIYLSGKVVTTETYYFTSGSIITVNIKGSGVAVNVEI